jgi:hypothetical protein
VGNEDTACIEEGITPSSYKNESLVPQDADSHADGPQQTVSQKPGAARVNRAKKLGVI